jgi:acetolactate synthase-1/2/3 large subunit
MNAAELFVECLAKLGVRRIYGVIGTSVVDFIDALYDAKHIRYISCRHEQVAASMADAEGRLTGFPGVAVVHAGPGTLNAAISVANAYKDGSPMVLIAGGAKRKLYGKNTMLEVNMQKIMEPITVFCNRVSESGEIPDVLGRAFSTAVKECGPAFIEVPEDLWLDEAAASVEECRFDPEKPKADLKEVEKAAKLLRKSSRPLIIAGYGLNCEEGSRVLLEFTRKTGIPVATTGNGRGTMNEEENLCLGRVGFGGGSIHADDALKNSDCVLCLGCQLTDITTYGYNIMPEGDIIAVTLDKEAENKLDYSLIAICDAVDFLRKLNQIVKEYQTSEEWWDTIDGWRQNWNSMLENAAKMKYDGYVNPALFFKELDERLKDLDDVVITSGQGMHILYTMSYLKIRKPRTYLAAINHGAMGFGLAAAMTSVLNGKIGIAVLGDGEFMMTIQDFETAVREKIPVKVIVVNDNAYRVLYVRQKIQKGGRVYGTLHSNPDFAELARIFGGDGIRINSDDQIEDGIEKMLSSNLPFIVDLAVNPDSFAPFNVEASVLM